MGQDNKQLFFFARYSNVPQPDLHGHTYYRHQCEYVVLQVAAVMLHHFAVGDQHDFNKTRVGEEAL